MERLSEVDHIFLGATVGPVEQLRRESNDARVLSIYLLAATAETLPRFFLALPV
jgi:hypothetical protein